MAGARQRNLEPRRSRRALHLDEGLLLVLGGASTRSVEEMLSLGAADVDSPQLAKINAEIRQTTALLWGADEEDTNG